MLEVRDRRTGAGAGVGAGADWCCGVAERLRWRESSGGEIV